MKNPKRVQDPRDDEDAVFVRAARSALGMSGEEFGALFDVGKANVSAWERGAHKPHWKQLLRMSIESSVPPPRSIEGFGLGAHEQEVIVLAEQITLLSPQMRRMLVVIVRLMLAESARPVRQIGKKHLEKP